MKLPRNDSRTTIIGKTGSGKSQFAAWLLSQGNFDARPWIVIDTKRDPFFTKLLRDRLATEKPLSWTPTRGEKGIFVIRPLPLDDAIEDFLWRIWKRGKVTLWIDEMYNIPQRRALVALLTQGRSKRIQMINLVQRPRDVSRFVLSEADHYSLFSLNDADDMKRVAEFMPVPKSLRLRQDYSSLWYDTRGEEVTKLLPVPRDHEILSTIAERVPLPFWW